MLIARTLQADHEYRTDDFSRRVKLKYIYK